jgi:hypothetical protein
MHSSPQVTFSLTIRAMSCRISFGSGGLPPRDFQRQYNLKPLRCQRMKILALTTTSAACQSNRRDQNNRHNREASAWSDSMVLVVGQLFSQEQDLGGQSRPRA